MGQRYDLRKSLDRITALARAPELWLCLAGLIIVYPLWVVARPPIQDLPQHVAAVRVLSSFSDPSYRFQEYFQLTLGRTQYLTVYLMAAMLAKLFGPTAATKLVLSLALILTPLSISRSLRALSFDPWLALLGLPFVFNVHVAYGFLNFVAAIPLLFYGLALAVEQQQRPTTKGRVWLAIILFACFYTHVVPFGLLMLALVVLTRWDKRALRWQALVVAPSVVATACWALLSPAGRVVSSLGRVGTDTPAPMTHLPFGAALRGLADWVIHITTDENENLRIIVWLVIALVLLVLSVAVPARRDSEQAPSRERSVTLGRVVVLLLAPLAMVAYFALPNGYGFIWPICQRFPVLAILLGLPLFAQAPRWAIRAAAAISLGLAVLGAGEQASIFRAAADKAYRGFDEVIAQIPKGSRVATLVFERQLEGLYLSPLMHAAGWLQTERGGVVMFSFAEFPSSPFTYRADRLPPPVAPRWEWGPERVVPDRDLGWYDYCLVQGWSGSLEASRRFNEAWRRGRWSLWRRTGPADPSPTRN